MTGKDASSLTNADAPAAPAPYHVLIVDDVPEILTLLQATLRRCRGTPIEVVVEKESAKALALVRTRPFDLVLSDYRMAPVDGLQILEAARATNPRGYRLLMSGYNEIPASMDRILRAGIDRYLLKPFDLQEALLLFVGYLHHDARTVGEGRAHARAIERMGLIESRENETTPSPRTTRSRPSGSRTPA